jgi:hypothetical protein
MIGLINNEVEMIWSMAVIIIGIILYFITNRKVNYVYQYTKGDGLTNTWIKWIIVWILSYLLMLAGLWNVILIAIST